MSLESKKQTFETEGGCDVSEERKKGWILSCDVGEATEGLEDEL